MTRDQQFSVPRRFRALLWAFPDGFRRECGDDYVRFLGCQRAEGRYQGVFGFVRFWREAIADALATGLRMRWSARRDQDGEARSPMGQVASSPGPDMKSPNDHRARGSLLDVIGQDFRIARRSLAAAPAFTAVAIITLALGIGANTAIFTVVDSVLLRDLPYANPDELVRVDHVSARSSVSAASWADFRDWREQVTSMSHLAGQVHFSTDVRFNEETRTLAGAAVTYDLFDLLGVQPAVGRGFTAEEDTAGGPTAVIISHRSFVEEFSADESALGRSIKISDDFVEVVGVMPPGFDYPESEGIEFWLPMRGDELLVDSGLPAESRTLGFINVVGRMAPGVSIEEAEAEFDAVVRRINLEHTPDRAESMHIELTSLHEAAVGDVRSALLLVLAAVGVVLAIACANVANLSLSKAAARSRQIAICSALGAPRGRLIRQQVLESALVGTAGGLVGIAIAFLSIDLLLAIAPTWLPRTGEIHVSGSVLAFTLAVSLGAGILSGLLPAFRASRTAGVVALGEATRSSTHGGRGLLVHNFLVATQVALAVVLLATAALFGNSFLRLVNVDPGFNPRSVLRASVSTPDGLEGSEAVLGFYEDVLARTRALPGVIDASVTYSAPFSNNEFRQTILPEGVEEDPDTRVWVGTVIVGDRYFETMGIPVLRGRDFDGRDSTGGAPVAVVNEAMAEQLWPDEDALGKRFRLTGGISGSLDSFDSEYFPDDYFTVVGVAGDVRRRALDEQPLPEFYRPVSQMAWSSQFLLVRTAENPGNMAELVRQAIWEIDRTVAINDVGTVREWMSDNVAGPRFRTVLTGAFALLATTLSMIGVYAVMAWGVTQRTREIGVRMALGAPGGVVLRQVLGRGLLIAGLGAAVGLGVAISVTRFAEAMLFQVSPTDPLTLVFVVALVLVVALLACFLPARRASRTDPLVALQSS